MKETRFPSELAALPNWVCWRLEPDKKTGRTAKVPYNPHTGYKASANNPATWGTLVQALSCAEKYQFTGIGFVFTKESGIVGLDVDHCLTDGKPNDIATDILARLPPTYIEISPSGTGLHIFLRGVLPAGGNRNSKHGVEMYSSARYFTMTGKRYIHEKSCENVATDNGAIDYIHQKFIAIEKTIKKKSSANQALISDDEIIRLAKKSADGAAFSALWAGQWPDAFPSQSEADYSLCKKLAFWTARDEAQIDRMFRSSGLYREKWDRQQGGGTYGEITVRNACKNTAHIYLPPNKKPETEIFEQGGAYYRRKGDKFSKITNFLVEPIEMVLSEDDAQITCDFITENGERFRQHLLSGDMAYLRTFKNVLAKRTIALSFFGTEGDLDLFKIHIYNNLEWLKKTGVKAMGIYQRSRGFVFVDINGAVGSGGRAVNDIVQVAAHKAIESTILQAKFIDKEGLLALGRHLLSYNEPAKTVSVLAWCAGCFIKPHLKHKKIKFPHLFLIGEPGSAKTSCMETVVMPMFGQARLYASSMVTPFVMMREANSSNIVPICLDEFKPSKMKGRNSPLHGIYNHLRDAYDWHKGVRGRPDQTQVFFDLLAPIALAGEESAEEAAVRERSIELLFSRKDTRDKVREAHYLWLLSNDAMVSCFGRSLLDTAMRTTPKDPELWHDEGKEFISEHLPSRVRNNLCSLYAGLALINKLCGYHGLSFEGVFGINNEDCAKHMEYAVRKYLLGDSTFNKGSVEFTFEILSRMPLKIDYDYAFENGGEFLVINIGGIYDKLTRYCRECNIPGEVLERSQFLKQLEHTDYFVKKNLKKRYKDKVKSSWVIDFFKLSKACDVSEFVQESAQEELDQCYISV